MKKPPCMCIVYVYRDRQPTVDVALVGDVQHMVDVGHNVRGQVGKGLRVVEHDGDGDLRGGVRCPRIHSLPPSITIPLNCDIVFSLIGVELCFELFPNMAAALRLLLQCKDTTWFCSTKCTRKGILYPCPCFTCLGVHRTKH